MKMSLVRLSKALFTTAELSTNIEGTEGPVVGAAHFSDPKLAQSIEYKITGMLLLL